MDEQAFTEDAESQNEEGSLSSRFGYNGHSDYRLSETDVTNPLSQRNDNKSKFKKRPGHNSEVRKVDGADGSFGAYAQKFDSADGINPFNKATDPYSARSSQLDAMEEGDVKAYMQNLTKKYEEMQMHL